MDWGPVIVSIIAAAGSILGVVISNNKSNREMADRIDRTQAVFEAHVTEQIDRLKADLTRVEAKQDRHNSMIERAYELEKTTELQGAELKRHGERIKILEGK